MQFKISPAPFLHQGTTVSQIMRQVLYALIPGIVVYVYFFGWGIVINILLASVTALSCEALMLWLRHRPLRPFLTDGSALVTAWLLASALPPFVPWWMTVLGTAFGIIFVKHLYGGLGHNPFNPAGCWLCGPADFISVKNDAMAGTGLFKRPFSGLDGQC
jgi:electron transport complex protein RnfD